MSRNMLVTFSVLLSSLICCRAYEVLNSTQMQLEQDSGLKNYEEEEDGKVLPYRCVHVLSDKITFNYAHHFRTFLTTVEIVLICVFTVLFVILMALLVVYLCMYGCVLPACCR